MFMGFDIVWVITADSPEEEPPVITSRRTGVGLMIMAVHRHHSLLLARCICNVLLTAGVCSQYITLYLRTVLDEQQRAAMCYLHCGHLMQPAVMFAGKRGARAASAAAAKAGRGGSPAPAAADEHAGDAAGDAAAPEEPALGWNGGWKGRWKRGQRGSTTGDGAINSRILKLADIDLQHRLFSADT
jgi:hypothetical protein